MPSLRIPQGISADEMLQYYRGEAKSVLAEASNVQTVQFPVSASQRFVSNDGVRGLFDLVFDERNKLLNLSRVTTNSGGLDRTV